MQDTLTSRYLVDYLYVYVRVCSCLGIDGPWKEVVKNLLCVTGLCLFPLEPARFDTKWTRTPRSEC